MSLDPKRRAIQVNVVFRSSRLCFTDYKSNTSLSVPGLAERRPSILVGDKIRLSPMKNEEVAYVGHVHRVDTSEVFLSLHKTFKTNIVYSAEFIPNRTSFRRMHQVLDVEHIAARIVYPNVSDVREYTTLLLEPLDVRLRENEAQLRAVSSMVAAPPSIPFIVFGP